MSLYPAIPGYVNVEAGYRLRFEDPADEFRYLLEAGMDFSEKWYRRVKLDGTLGIGNEEQEKDFFGNPTATEDYDLGKLDVCVGYKLTDRYGVEFGVTPSIYGKNTAVGSMGITADTAVVVYSSSPIFAARLWWILKYAGVEDVRVLNGGYDAWIGAGYEEKPEYQSDEVRIADIRTNAEYTGETSGYSYLVNKGRVPGAVWAHDADSANPDYLDADGTLTSFDQVRDRWATMGIESTQAENTFDKEVIFYCGGGYRSSLSYLYAYLMGFENVRNYSDGWMGWSTHYIEDAYILQMHQFPAAPTDGFRSRRAGLWPTEFNLNRISTDI